VLGSAHPLTPPHRPHNSLYVISDQGHVVNRYAPDLHIALNLARPWRASAKQGDIYRSRQVDDPRSTDVTII
jgi:hypothetical protein